MNDEQEKAFAELAAFAYELVSEPIHKTLLVRKIEECKKKVEEHGNVS